MNILFVSDIFTNGGLESRILEEIAQYKKHNINIYLACEKLHPKHKEIFKETLILKSLQQNYEKINIPEVLEARNSIYKFCKNYSIDFIECQPFWCVLPAVLAAEKLKTPISFTLHGLDSGNFVNNTFAETQMIFYIILKYGFDKIFAVAEYLADRYCFLSSNILIARNGSNFQDKIIKKEHRHSGKIAIASRLDQPKTNLITNFLDLIKNTPNINSIDIFGEGDCQNILKKYLQQTKNQKASIQGWEENLVARFEQENYDAVFGMGKVVLDGIKSNTPTGILGYGGFIDFITPKNINFFAKTNLTSWDSFSGNLSQLFSDVQTNPKKYLFKKSDLEIFDNDKNWQNYLNTIQKITFQEKPTISKLNRILEAKPTSIAKEIQNNVIPELDLIYPIFNERISIFNKNREEEAKIRNLEKELSAITESKFWKITKPIRNSLQKIHKNGTQK